MEKAPVSRNPPFHETRSPPARPIADADLRSGLADYYVLVAARRGGLGPYQLLPEYREMVRGRMRSDIMRYYWQACYQQAAGVTTLVDCPPPEGATGIAEIIRQLLDRALSNTDDNLASDLMAIQNSFGSLRDAESPDRGPGDREAHLGRMWRRTS